MYSIVDSSHTNDDDCPYGTDEKAKGKGKVEGIERRMEIVVSPLLGSESLNGGIGCGGAGHENTQQRGIEGINVV
jgi:hypothetical protein